MTATEIVTEMMDRFERENGKPATEMHLAGELYDSLKSELRAQIPSALEIDYIKLRGVLIQRSRV